MALFALLLLSEFSLPFSVAYLKPQSFVFLLIKIFFLVIVPSHCPLFEMRLEFIFFLCSCVFCNLLAWLIIKVFLLCYLFLEGTECYEKVFFFLFCPLFFTMYGRHFLLSYKSKFLLNAAEMMIEVNLLCVCLCLQRERDFLFFFSLFYAHLENLIRYVFYT